MPRGSSGSPRPTTSRKAASGPARSTGRRTRVAGHPGRKNRLLQTDRHDTYRRRGNWPEPTWCPRCDAVFTKGRWTWDPVPPGAAELVCPACRRIADQYPAGTLILEGPFFETHREQLINLVRNVEKAEKSAHPLERIMAIEEEDGRARVTTTGVHLARRIGEALFRAYEGDLSYQYGDGVKLIRATWKR